MKVFHTIHNNKIIIRHNDLIYFLGENGFKMMKYANGKKQLVKVIENIIENATDSDIVTCIKTYLIKIGETDVLELFTKGVNTFTTPKKLEFLPEIEAIIDKDPKDCAWFYFNNTAVKITANSIELISYSNLPHTIWKNRILNREFTIPSSSKGQFFDFMFLISKKEISRLLSLQTALGYLLHRYNDPSVPKAIIFCDENISFDGTANGGTGKGILSLALGHCKNLEVIDGQQLKGESRFKNQRINITTDIVLFDDVSKKFTIDEIKSMITSGITVEKKGKDEIHISSKDAPKLMISSNYIVGGSGGSTDRRRRFDLEIADYFSDKHTPIDEFGNLFFEEWDASEWNMFDLLMIENTQLFLKYSLVEAPLINLKNNKVMCNTNPEFKTYANKEFTIDIWFEKDLHFSKFILENPVYKSISSHQFTKWIKEYAKIHDLLYESKNPGGIQQFVLRSNLIQDKNEKGE
ncbi:MAG: DUF5906 domain-containing protein [Flavobacterium nitrogenifigens]|uniref:primase-helicase family protein n=1 Tax=Flavobacterium nitrogenifigens TaxID=1617283 RepID=UPI0028091C46|nr:DUF5906 domain-containing protein [Flavobacterium nitrogenifigens]MDQ8011390.1 DUF5906 domain-containing protein [Flavobacterium nitrogenifigens]